VASPASSLSRLAPLASRAVLERMVEAVRHRGPDAAGVLPRRARRLGHRRLSIIDLAGGKQPLLHAGWQRLGHVQRRDFQLRRADRGAHLARRQFRTRSDTETILHAYAEHGPACVKAFNGDFAYASGIAAASAW